MAGRIIFGVICILSVFSLYLSYLILRHKHRPPALTYLGISYVFFALWLLWSFVHLLPEEPGAHFITLQYRICYVLIPMALGFLLLFASSYLKGADARTSNKVIALSACAVLVAMAVSDTVIRRARFVDSQYLVDYGPLYPLFMALVLIMTAAFFWTLVVKIKRSSGVERMRALYIILGYFVFALSCLILSIVIPLVTGRDAISDYCYPIMVFPLTTTAYALLRHRLLDIRLAARRAFSYMLVLLLFGAPLLALFAVLGYRLRENPSVLAAVTLTVVTLSSLLIPPVLKMADALSTRVVFGKLYSKEDVVESVVSLASSGSDRQKIVLPALRTLKERLGLREVAAILYRNIPNSPQEDQFALLSATTGKEEVLTPDMAASLQTLMCASMVAETCGDYEEDDHAEMRGVLRSAGFQASLVLKGPRSAQGILLAGPKENGADLDPYDLDTLEECSLRLGMLLENHQQAERLSAQLVELKRISDVLRRSDRFKDQVIALARRELGEPVEHLLQLVRDYLETSGEDLPEEIREMVEDAAKRLGKVMDKFTTAFLLKSGEYKPQVTEVNAYQYLEKLLSPLNQSDKERISVSLEQGLGTLRTDPYLLGITLKELLENALRHSGDNAPVQVRLREERGGISIEVEDAGDGIPEDFFRRIFTPFAQAVEPEKHQEGLGLGLYIVRLATELCGIGVEVETGPGKGSLFRLIIERGGDDLSHPESTSRVNTKRGG